MASHNFIWELLHCDEKTIYLLFIKFSVVILIFTDYSNLHTNLSLEKKINWYFFSRAF